MVNASLGIAGASLVFVLSVIGAINIAPPIYGWRFLTATSLSPPRSKNSDLIASDFLLTFDSRDRSLSSRTAPASTRSNSSIVFQHTWCPPFAGLSLMTWRR